ncbi:hypothetical protein [Taibaiella chishuiensis]|uniref:Uncharacterized protein n=1 Tax=Taibaiella chishuiensis TaxID=1434707 RepID=A0A2P8D810_9BACT|nr:hypothetical protein [Taibaiella chishuiensis]PSK93375.1 hypothetical protein B0I18_102345 [Taibaiella chishuiensis]
MDHTPETIKQKNSRISVSLIVVNVILLFIFAHVGAGGADNSESQAIENGIICFTGVIVLLGGYAFSYHGKGYRIGKWLFGIALLIGLILLGLLWYVAQLAHAFQH